MKWEYLCEYNSSDYTNRYQQYPYAPIQDYLNTIGDDGWEAIQVTYVGDGLMGLTSQFLVIAKRPKK